MGSRADAEVFSRAGFKEVYSMEGGINAWNGLVATGVPEAGMAYFSPATRPEELMALAWLLEEGTRNFYEEIGKRLAEGEAGNLFQSLTADEENHKESLLTIYQEAFGPQADPGFPGSVIAFGPQESYLEGGMPVSDALGWIKGKNLLEILELSISLEVNAQDLYLKMERKVEDQQVKKAFQVLAEAEKKHLERLNSLFEKNLEGGESS